MTVQDKCEMYAFNIERGTQNAHKHGLSWKAIEETLQAQLDCVRAKTFPQTPDWRSFCATGEELG